MTWIQDLTLREVADITGFHVETIRRYAVAGLIPGAYKMGSSWRVTTEGLDELRGVVPKEDPPKNAGQAGRGLLGRRVTSYSTNLL